MGRHMIRLLKFFMRYPGWQTVSGTDTAARRAISRLCNMGLCERNDFGQIRACIGSKGLTLAEVRDGTGYTPGTRFVEIGGPQA